MVLRRPLSTTTLALARMAMAPAVQEIQLRCSDGIVLAGQSWRAHDGLFHSTSTSTTSESLSSSATATTESPLLRILCLHGWMDNARSFHFLAPALVAEQPRVELVALDFVGHGLSSHKSLDGPSVVLAEAVYYVAEALHQLGWTNNNNNNNQNDDKNCPVALIGHSMGAGISCLYAAAFPEQIQKLVLLEGAGPMDRNPREVAQHIRAHVTRRLTANQVQPPKLPRIYPTLELAVETRCQTARNFPGQQWLSTEAATEMVLRGTYPVFSNSNDQTSETIQPTMTTTTTMTSTLDDPTKDGVNSGVSTTAGFRFRHDPRLQWPSCQFLTWEQTSALYEDIKCPTALLLAHDGWPFDEEKQQRALELLKPSKFETLPGSHHFHADPDTAEAVAEKVLEFLNLN